jgi:hypothetical protein
MALWLVSSPSVTALMTMSATMNRSVRGSLMTLRSQSIGTSPHLSPGAILAGRPYDGKARKS